MLSRELLIYLLNACIKKKKQENPHCDCSDHLGAGAPGDVVTTVFESQYLPL